MSIALDLRTGVTPIGGENGQLEKLLAWVRAVDATTVHVTLRGAIREPHQRQLQRTLLGMGCRITLC
jgi:hypothetical protein